MKAEYALNLESHVQRSALSTLTHTTTLNILCADAQNAQQFLEKTATARSVIELTAWVSDRRSYFIADAGTTTSPALSLQYAGCRIPFSSLTIHFT